MHDRGELLDGGDRVGKCVERIKQVTPQRDGFEERWVGWSAIHSCALHHAGGDAYFGC